MILVNRQNLTIAIDRLAVPAAAGKRIAQVVQHTGITWLLCERATQCNLSLVVQFHAKQCRPEMIVYFRIVRAFACRTFQVADRISMLCAIETQHTQQVQCIEMPGILRDQRQAYSF